MEYQKQGRVRGPWLKKTIELNGKKAKLVEEVKQEASNFKDDKGNVKMQDRGKIQIEGESEVFNFSVNKPTINALIDAFGKDSKDWCNQPLTIAAEKVIVSGKRGVSVYLIPEGFKLGEDDGGYIVITKKNGESKEEEIEYPESDETGF